MKTKLILIACLLLANTVLFGQNTRFTTSGTIEFEKSVNMFALIKKMYSSNSENALIQQAIDSYKKTQPQFRVLKSTLTFSSDKTLFTPIAPETAPSNFFNLPVAEQNNTVFCDMGTNTSAIQKKVFEQIFLVKDTIRKIKWKITDETREILGYHCRRANGLMLDSIYVVAFYTDKIPVSGGPESFAGLPGMILQVSLPHENLAWLATKINDAVEVPATAVVPPKKGKIVNNKQLAETLRSVFKDWGDDSRINMMMKSYLL